MMDYASLLTAMIEAERENQENGLSLSVDDKMRAIDALERIATALENVAELLLRNT